MKDNLVRFPHEGIFLSQKKPVARSVGAPLNSRDNLILVDFVAGSKRKADETELHRMRQAFDFARKNWPSEDAEVPELNKMFL